MSEQHPEAGRIAFLMQRDGRDATIRWVRNMVRTYRQAVLNPHHFASTPCYRHRFIAAYCDFKRWLAGAPRERPARAPDSPRAPAHHSR